MCTSFTDTSFLVVLYRLLNLKNTFESKYGEAPLFYAYAPGRVNLIGEYCLTKIKINILT